jgi:hypothetical protein
VDAGLRHAEAAGQAAEDLGVRQALAGRGDRRLVPAEVEVAVRVVQVGVLGLHRARQQQVGVVGGVRLEVVDDDREEVLAREPAAHALLVGDARHRVARVDHGAAARIPPVTGHAGDAGDRSHGHAAAGVPLQPHRDADAGRPRGGRPVAERDDALARQAGDLAHALGRKFEDAAPEHLPAERVGLDERAVLAALGDHVEEAEGQRGVGARPRRQVLVGGGGGAGADRIERDDVGAVPAGHLDVLPQVMVRRQRVGAPEEDRRGWFRINSLRSNVCPGQDREASP